MDAEDRNTMADVAQQQIEQDPEFITYRLENLLERRPFLLSHVVLRQNIHNVYEWLNLAKLCEVLLALILTVRRVLGLAHLHRSRPSNRPPKGLREDEQAVDKVCEVLRGEGGFGERESNLLQGDGSELQIGR